MAEAAAAHLVQFYSDTEHLASSLSSLFAGPLQRGETVVVVAQDDHREALDAALCDAGVDLAAEYRSGRYLPLDATDALAGFMTAEGPDEERFRAGVGSAVLEARRRTGSVHAYGEMVGILAARGDLVAALELEDLWTRLLDRHPFQLLCGYPREVIGESAAFDGICALHDAVLVTREPAEPALSATVDLPPGADAAAAALRAAREVLAGWGVRDAACIADAGLVASELVTLGGRQGSRRVRLGLALEGEHVVVSVTDDAAPAGQPPTHDDLAQSGRLFSVLSSLAPSWGVQSLPHGRRLWARLPACGAGG